MGKHTKYEFPSAFMNEIERPLRRDVIARMNRRSTLGYYLRVIAVSVLAGLLAAYLLQTLVPALSAVPVEGKPIVMVNGERGDMTTLCARYRSDHLMTGDKMDAETKALCGI